MTYLGGSRPVCRTWLAACRPRAHQTTHSRSSRLRAAPSSERGRATSRRPGRRWRSARPRLPDGIRGTVLARAAPVARTSRLGPCTAPMPDSSPASDSAGSAHSASRPAAGAPGTSRHRRGTLLRPWSRSGPEGRGMRLTGPGLGTSGTSRPSAAPADGTWRTRARSAAGSGDAGPPTRARRTVLGYRRSPGTVPRPQSAAGRTTPIGPGTRSRPARSAPRVPTCPPPAPSASQLGPPTPPLPPPKGLRIPAATRLSARL